MNASPSRRSPRLVIIGGGATGTGIAAAAVQQGYKVVLVDRAGLGQGTTGHFHGILHSGARYAVNDPAVAAECYQENQRLRQLIPSAVRDTGGLFVALTDAEAAHADTLLAACRTAGIPTTELSAAAARQAEPHLSAAVQRAFLVPDGYIDGPELIRLNAAAAGSATQLLSNHVVVAVRRSADTITGVEVRHAITGATEVIDCDYVVNATGVWAGRIAALVDIPLELVFDKGTMIAFGASYSQRVLNRCRPEADGDLLVPGPLGSVLGTTARMIADPDDCLPTQEEVDALMREGVAMLPALATAEATQLYAGVRPLLKSADFVAGESTRAVSRSFRVIDHADHGVTNMISVVGGKVTLYRRMAEAALDVLAAKRA